MTTKASRPVWLAEDQRRWDHIRVHHQLLADPRIDGIGIGVYCGLVCHADVASGECFPAEDTIAGYVGATARTVRERLSMLELAGYVRVTRRPGKASLFTILPVPPLPAHVAAQIESGARRLLYRPSVPPPRVDAPPLDFGEPAPPPPVPEYQGLVNLLAARIGERTGKSPKIYAKWEPDMRRLAERGPVGWAKPEPVPAETIEATIEFVFGPLGVPDSKGFCWADQVGSPGGLRKHWDRLRGLYDHHQQSTIRTNVVGQSRAETREARNAEAIRGAFVG